MKKIEFFVEGDPKGKGRPRFRRAGNFVQTYTDAKTKSYEQKISEAAKIAMNGSEPFKQPLWMTLRIYMPVPKSYSKKRSEACLNGFEYPTKKPDIDNIAKAFLDAMNGIAYMDDIQVVMLTAYKSYAETAGVEVECREYL
jgi:Holliday junction resolvase RusA-like endonuclease